MNRNTYTLIDLKSLDDNITYLINKYKDYKYKLAVVKADCYNHGINKTLDIIMKKEINYLVVATLEEALKIRRKYKDINILCLTTIKEKNIDLCKKNNITITINNINNLEEIKEKIKDIKVHIKINTGMNRLGINNKNELKEVYKTIKKKEAILEGIFTHVYNSENKTTTDKQIKKFIDITQDINLKKIKIVHIFASDSSFNYEKLDFMNGIRFGINMYGLGKEKLSSTFKLISEVIQINNLEKNETVGYNEIYKAKKKTKIATVAIGYADGINRKYKDNYVYINDKRYQIVGICMDMLFIKVDDKVKINDKVYILKDNNHIRELANSLETIPYEIICNISKRVPKKYIKL